MKPIKFIFFASVMFANLAFAGGGSYDDSNTPAAASSIDSSVDSSVLQNIKLSDSFKGFALGFSGGYQDTDSNGDRSPKVNGVSQTGVTTSGFDDSENIYTIGGSYNFAINEKYLLGIGFDYNLNDIDIGKSKATGELPLTGMNMSLKTSLLYTLNRN